MGQGNFKGVRERPSWDCRLQVVEAVAEFVPRKLAVEGVDTQP